MNSILSVLLGLLIEVIIMGLYDITSDYLGKYNIAPTSATREGNILADLAEHPEIEGYDAGGAINRFWTSSPVSSAYGNFFGTEDSIYKALAGSGKYSEDDLRDTKTRNKLKTVAKVLSAARGGHIASIGRSRRDMNFLHDADYTDDMKQQLDDRLVDIIYDAYNSNTDIGNTLKRLVAKEDVTTLNHFLRNKVVFPALGIFRDKYAQQAGEKIFDTYNPEPKSEDINSSTPIPEFPKLTPEDYTELEASYGPNSALAQVPSMNSIAKQIYNPNAVIDEKRLVDREVSAYKIREAKRLKEEEARKKAEYDAWVESLKPKRSPEAEAERQRLMKELGF